jgi:hypothetical protein
MSNKPRKKRVEEQGIIYDFIDRTQRAYEIVNHELGSPSDVVPKFIRHDGYNFSLPIGRTVKLHLKIEVEFTNERDVEPG